MIQELTGQQHRQVFSLFPIRLVGYMGDEPEFPKGFDHWQEGKSTRSLEKAICRSLQFEGLRLGRLLVFYQKSSGGISECIFSPRS